jgi:tRNA dimethylallyltransferase
MAQSTLILTGPTASGKKSVSLLLAASINAEIISMDSMKVFKAMDIGTAKPGAKARAEIPHYLIDVVAPDEEFNVGKYIERVRVVRREILERGRQVLFVGGTPLYLKAITEGIFEGPSADWELRKELEASEREKGPGFLHERLKAVDPVSAGRLHPNDTKRILRALEVYEKTGKPISALQRQFGAAKEDPRHVIFGLRRDRDELNRRIEQRVDGMFEAGLVDEVKRLLDTYRLSRQAREAVGYREVIEYLEERRSLEETVALVKKSTRYIARKQLTWFRSMPDIIWIDAREDESAGDIVARIEDRLGGGFRN